jgi:hypothetical protein
VRALEPLAGWRVAAAPPALDGAQWQGDRVQVLRFAPDEAFGVGATGVVLDDPHAISVDERGFLGTWLSIEALRTEVVPHVEWHVPGAGPALAQGRIAGVPAKLWLPGGGAGDGADGSGSGADGAATGGEVLLLVHAAHAHDLADRLGWTA